jgi:fucose 4-O-acetylase-like acetyltransferase
VVLAAGRLHYLDNLRTFLIFLVVLVHAGVVYESSGIMGPYWIVDDPSTSDLPGLVNLMLDLFVMPTIFFISGCFTPVSLEALGSRRFLKAKLRRLMIPWLFAVMTLIPLYNAVFLYSRGLSQGGWTRYFHFTNDTISMSWLWFLPVLFLFNVVYLLMKRLRLPIGKLPLGWAVAAVFALSVGYSEILGRLDWVGWTKTPLLDFQNERLVPHFLVFLLGALCRGKGVLTAATKSKKLYIAVGATAWIPMNVYLIVLLNFFLRPGEYIVSAAVDGFVLWTSLHASMLGLLYCAVSTFKRYLNRRGRLGAFLNPLSYGVYIIHIVAMAPFALVLLGIDLPALVKYPILALATYGTSNVIAYAYALTVAKSRAARAARVPVSGCQGQAPVSASPAVAGRRRAGSPLA